MHQTGNSIKLLTGGYNSTRNLLHEYQCPGLQTLGNAHPKLAEAVAARWVTRSIISPQ